MRLPRHRQSLLRLASLLAVTAVLVSSCTTVVAGSARIAVPEPGSPIEWGPCGPALNRSDVPAEALCGKLSVPVDYTNPDGDVAQIALLKFPAEGPDRIGSLVINPGGPGESGVDAAISIHGLLPDDVRQRFDLVGFDPRGVGLSTPAVWCNSDQDNDNDRADPPVEFTDEGVAEIEGRTQQFVQRCVDKTGSDFLANVGTVNVAKDLDALRAALGDEKLTYLGYSYGTSIGSAYAEQFPQNVRAMILDGAVDPNQDLIQASLNQSEAFQGAFEDYAAECALSPDCPLGTDPDKATEVYLDLVTPLATDPAPTEDPRGLSYSDAVMGTILPLYSPGLWKYLTQGLTQLKTTGRGDVMLALADMYMGRDSDGHYDNSTDARVAINCVDKPAVTDRAAIADADKRSRELAPFMNYGEYTGQAPLWTCAFWPVPTTSEPHEISVEGLPQVLVISTTNDPATPYQAGVDLAEQLDARLLTFEGTQHTVAFQGNECVDAIAAQYLINLALPPPDSRC